MDISFANAVLDDDEYMKFFNTTQIYSYCTNHDNTNLKNKHYCHSDSDDNIQGFMSYLKGYLQKEFSKDDIKTFIDSNDYDLEKFSFHFFNKLDTKQFYELFCEITKYCYHPEQYSFVFSKVIGYMIKYIINFINYNYSISKGKDHSNIQSLKSSLQTYKKFMKDILTTNTITYKSKEHIFTWKFTILYSILQPFKCNMGDFIFDTDHKFKLDMKNILLNPTSHEFDMFDFEKYEINHYKKISYTLITNNVIT
jgi:hypothetical protein